MERTRTSLAMLSLDLLLARQREETAISMLTNTLNTCAACFAWLEVQIESATNPLILQAVPPNVPEVTPVVEEPVLEEEGEIGDGPQELEVADNTLMSSGV
jgi:hypothetical protein